MDVVCWAIVPGWDNYLVSDLGTVYVSQSDRVVMPSNCRRAYITIYRRVYKIREQRAVNPGRLVLEAFVGPCPKGMECCHADDNPRNNALTNLRWDTHLSNARDCLRNGRYSNRKGQGNGRSIMTDEKVLEARRLYKKNPTKWTYTRLSYRYGITRQAIRDIIIGKRWSHL